MGSIEDDFRGTVPTSDNVFGESFLDLFLFVTSSETKITNLEFTAFVKKHIAGLQVSMNDVGWVQVVAATQELMHKILHVLISEFLSGVDNSVHVSLHKLCDNVNIFIAWLSWGLEHIN